MPPELEALIDAAKSGDEARVRSIIAARPELVAGRLPSGESAVMAALYRGHRDLAIVMVELGAGLDVFASAALGDLDGLRAALAVKDVVNAAAFDGWTPLHLAAFFGQLEAARMLIEAGADVRAVSRNSMENTALHAAAAGRHQDVALLLLARGADPDVPDAGGFTPAGIAEENGLVPLRKPADRAEGGGRSTSTGRS